MILIPATHPRTERLNAFIAQIRAGYYYAQQQQQHEDLIAFLTDNTAPEPTLTDVWWLSNLFTVLHDRIQDWDAFDDRLMRFATRPGNWTNPAGYSALGYWFYHGWLSPRLTQEADRSFLEAITKKLRDYGIAEDEIVGQICSSSSHNYLTDSNKLTGAGDYVLARVSTSFLGFKKPSSLFPVILQHSRSVPLLKLLLLYEPAVADKQLADFLHLSYYNDLHSTSEDCAEVLLMHNAAKYEPTVSALLPKITHPDSMSKVLTLLARYVPAKYGGRDLEQTYAYFDLLRQELLRVGSGNYNAYQSSYSQTQKRWVSVHDLRLATLLDLEQPAKARAYLLNWMTDCPGYPVGTLEMVTKKYGQDALPLLMTALNADPGSLTYGNRQLFTVFFRLLGTLDYAAYLPKIWAITRHKNKKLRELAAVTLAKLGDAAIPEASTLLTDKKADARQTGALLLSLIRTDRATALLMQALDGEKNDDTRDLMLDSLAGTLPPPTTAEAGQTRIDAARQRGKLDAPVAKWLMESSLPTLYWQTNNSSGEHLDETLDADAVRFLLYRQSRAKTMKPDAEARPLIARIDRDRSPAFANALLHRYFDNGADPKLKGWMVLGAMLGGDAETDLLKTKVNQWAEANRGKMAEHAVQALALAGSNKALRAVEFFSRKYRSKNKNIGAAATEAFTIAAETMGIPAYELADSIIPDFGFSGLFREFDAGGETVRAFVDTDFKLAFLNDDNRVLKAVPKATPADLKDEFKEIGKEIRDIVKAQSGRLEQYLVTQRKWDADKWDAFFRGNPVMFAYAVRLVWGLYDADQQLISTFRCQEDQTLINADGDELELPETGRIGMVHPLSLTAAEVAFWRENLADSDVAPIFPQLNRPTVPMPDTARSLTRDHQFTGIEHGGYAFVSRMEKSGWARGSVQDSGSIASYYKEFADLGITAIVLQEGILCVGYYDENAALGPVFFVRNKSVRFGNYSYDEPANDTDPRLIPFADVPPIIYSEIMADMIYFRENDARKPATNG